MPLADFIISVFCWVDAQWAEILQGRKAASYARAVSTPA